MTSKKSDFQFFDLADLINEYQQWLSSIQAELKQHLSKAPKGRLRLAYQHGKPRFYQCSVGEGSGRTCGKYLGKEDIEKVIQLAQKGYECNLLSEVQRQLSIIESMDTSLGKGYLMNCYDSQSEIRKNLSKSIFKTPESRSSEWLATEFSPKHIEITSSTPFTEKGEPVRSKSEKMLADKLYFLGIPYKYECPLYLTGYGTVYPDFTILNKHTGEIVYLEHLGMMDDPDYVSKVVQKLRTYEKNGIILGKNLFITFETRSGIVDPKILETLFSDFI